MQVKTNAMLGTLSAVAFLSFPAATNAQDSIVGVWWSPTKDAKIEITEKNGIYSGQIIAGVDRLDSKNPNRALRGRHLLGTVLAKDMRFVGDGKWEGGTFYDPDSGTTFRCKMWLDGRDKLMLRGFIGLSLIGKTQACMRVGGPNPKSPQPGEPKLDYPSGG